MNIFLYGSIILVVLIVIIFLILRAPQFGKLPSGVLYKRIQQSPNYKNGVFQNLNHTPALTEGATYRGILRDNFFRKSKQNKPATSIPVIRQDLKTISNESPSITWFGHSSYFIKMHGMQILVDPVFSGHAAPFSMMVKNFRGANPYQVEDFPDIDLLIITHDHFDHLDYQTIRKLRPKVKQVITSLGVGAHFEHWGYHPSMIHQLDWYEEITVSAGIEITAVPARHFSGRQFKRNQTLWSSFVLKSLEYSLFLGGDSGYDDHFKAIGAQYGPFDLAILECGQYNAHWKYIHMFPEEVVDAALALNAARLWPVHWGKFSLALHAWNESINRVTLAAEGKPLEMVTPQIGETVFWKEKKVWKPWWNSIT